MFILGTAYGFSGKVPKEIDDSIEAFERENTEVIEKPINYDKMKQESLDIARVLNF